MTRIFSAVLLAVGVLVLTVNGFAASTPRTCPTGITKDMVINYNDYVTCSLDYIGETAFYRFQGTTGEKISIVMSASSAYGPCFSLWDPTNTRIQEVCEGGYYGQTVISATYTLGKTGTYTVRAYDAGFDNMFSYKLYLERFYPSYGAVPIAYGQNPSGSIGPAEETDQWAFAGAKNDQIAIQVNAQYQYGPCFTLHQPDGTIIQTICEGGYYGQTLIRGEFTLPATGTYLIRVSDNGGDNTWDYNLLLQCMGTCTAGTLGLPTVNISLTGCTTACKTGDTFSAKLTASNPPGKITELKLGFYLPDASTTSVGYPHLELPPQFTFDGEVLRGPITAAHPRGNWRFCGRVIELAVGDILAASCQAFTIVP
jgi:hypothetical protein